MDSQRSKELMGSLISQLTRCTRLRVETMSSLPVAYAQFFQSIIEDRLVTFLPPLAGLSNENREKVLVSCCVVAQREQT